MNPLSPMLALLTVCRVTLTGEEDQCDGRGGLEDCQAPEPTDDASTDRGQPHRDTGARIYPPQFLAPHLQRYGLVVNP